MILIMWKRSLVGCPNKTIENIFDVIFSILSIRTLFVYQL